MLMIFLCLTVFTWRLFPQVHTNFMAYILLTVRSCESVVNEPWANFSLFERKNLEFRGMLAMREEKLF